MARPTKYSASMTKNLCDWIHKGCTFKDSCCIEGISYQTFNEWKKEKPEFSDAIKKAQVSAKVDRIDTILKASDEKWQAAAWWLERMYPSEFALKRILEVRDEREEDEFDRYIEAIKKDAVIRTGGSIEETETSDQRDIPRFL